jgi:hypothetical protein
MERIISRVAAVIEVVAFSSVLVLAKGAMAKEAESSVRIKGTVAAAAYDEDGKVADVVIAAGEDTYEVAEGDRKMELMHLIDSEITIVGSVTEEEGIKTIEIEKYTVDK